MRTFPGSPPPGALDSASLTVLCHVCHGDGDEGTEASAWPAGRPRSGLPGCRSGRGTAIPGQWSPWTQVAG